MKLIITLTGLFLSAFATAATVIDDAQQVLNIAGIFETGIQLRF